MYYYQNDQLGAPYKIIDNTGFVVWSAQFDSFGQAHLNSNNLIVNNLRFPGQFYDAETGLHYNWHRYYDPELGRYISSDPIGLGGGANLYGYVAGNPVIYVDVDGRLAVNVGAALNFRKEILSDNATFTSVVSQTVIGAYSAFFAPASIVGKFTFGIAFNAASQSVGCKPLDMSALIGAGIVSVVSPGGFFAKKVTTNRPVQEIIGQQTNSDIGGLF